MRALAVLSSLLVAVACVSTQDPNAPTDDPSDEEPSEGDSKGDVDARPGRPDGGLTVIHPADAASPPVPLDAATGPPKGKRIFVSSTTVDGNLGGVEGADRVCQELADAATLGGSWKALVSTSSQSGVDRMANVGPYYRLDGEKAFETREEMRGVPLVAIDVTDAFTQLPSDGVWTGMTFGGIPTGDTCDDWHSNADGLVALLGDLAQSDDRWIDYGGGGACSDAWRLYCVEQ
jgi:Protein of unknown function (DUF1554)